MAETAKNGVEVSDVENKIITQVEFYFGDFNLTRDNFLKREVERDDGWVKLETLLTFKRLRALSEDADIIVASLGKSKSGLLEISEDKTKIRRSTSKPLAELNKDKLAEKNSLTVYVKGFPTDSVLDDLLTFFGNHGPVGYVYMRRDKEKNFKGSVFVEFSDTDTMKKFLDQKELDYRGAAIIKMLKSEYHAMKSTEKKANRDVKKSKEKEEKVKQRRLPGAILQIEGFDPMETTIVKLRETFKEFGEIAWVTFQKGDPTAKIRFRAENGAIKALEKTKATDDGKLKLGETELTLRVLEGEEETAYYEADEQERKKFDSSKGNKNPRRKSQRQKGFRKRQWDNKNKASEPTGSDEDVPDSGDQGDSDDEPPIKKKNYGENAETEVTAEGD